jgi:hypothetical protein
MVSNSIIIPSGQHKGDAATCERGIAVTDQHGNEHRGDKLTIADTITQAGYEYFINGGREVFMFKKRIEFAVGTTPEARASSTVRDALNQLSPSDATPILEVYELFKTA